MTRCGHLLGIGALMLTSACAASHMTWTEVAVTRAIAPTSTREMPGTFLPTVVSQNVPTSETVPDLGPKGQSLVQACPSQREVPLAELDLEPDNELLVLPSNTDRRQYEIVSGVDSSRSEFENSTMQSNWPNQTFESISPDGKWVMFYDMSNGSSIAKVWISSPDGKRQWDVADVDSRTSASWISAEEIVIYGQLTERESIIPLEVINPFTRESRPLIALPDTVWFLYLSLQEGNPYAIYYDPLVQSESSSMKGGFFLYDYNADKVETILGWMNGEAGVQPDKFEVYSQVKVRIDDDGLALLMIERPYGFDLGLNLTLAQLRANTSYDEVMKPIEFPDAGPNVRLNTLAPTSLAVDRYDRSAVEPRRSGFYGFDFSEQVIVDYCLDRGHASPSVRLSIDKKHVAWTVFALEGGYQTATETVVLDLISGQFSKIPDVEFLGWLKAP